MTRERALELMRTLPLADRQSLNIVPLRLDEPLPTFRAADRTTGQRITVDYRTFDESKHDLLEGA